MKTLPTQVINAVDRPGVRAVPLVEITLTQPSALTIRLSDRPYWHNGQFYEPLLLSEPTSTQGNVNPATWQFTTGSCSFQVINDKPIFAVERFSDLVYHPVTNPSGHVFEFAQCTLSVVFEDTPQVSPGESNRVLRYAGRLEALRQISPQIMVLDIADIILALNERLELLVAGLQNLPLMHEDDIGRAANIIYGRAIEVPTLRAAPGGAAVLLEDIGLESDAIVGGRLRIANCARFNPAGGQITLGSEILSYASAVCKEDSGDVGYDSGSVTNLAGVYLVSLSAIGTANVANSSLITEFPASVVAQVPIVQPFTLGTFKTSGNQDKRRNADDNIVHTQITRVHSFVALYRNPADLPGTTLTITTGGLLGILGSVGLVQGEIQFHFGPTGALIEFNDFRTFTGITVRIVELRPPSSLEELQALKYITNPPVVLSVLHTFSGTKTGIGESYASLSVGTIPFIGVDVVSEPPDCGVPSDPPSDPNPSDASPNTHQTFTRAAASLRFTFS